MTPALPRMTVAALGLMCLAGCTVVGPDYQRPDAPVSAAFKEAGGGWKAGEPRQPGPEAWWSTYDDAVLDQLERQVAVSNQTLKQNEAAYRLAMATLDQARAAYSPTVTGDASGQRSGRSGNLVVQNQYNLSLAVAWAPDLWGRIHRTVESDVASAQASAADLAAVRLSAQSALAGSYFQLRASDELKRLLDDAADAYTRSLAITRNQYAAGVASRADMVTAETQLLATRSQAVAVGVQRAQLEHAIAVLIGKPPADFAIAPALGLASVPAVPGMVPSALLERRPDIAGEERRMAAANAQIGVAEAAFYPDLTLSASGGFAATALSSLLTSSAGLWALGPQLAQTLFDGGARAAQVEQARATYDRTVAAYRQTVLAAFQQVEDQLAALRILAEQALVQDQVVASAMEAERLTLNQYRAGTVAYTTVVTAQAAALTARQTALSIRQSRLTASVVLIESLGGGWDAGALTATR